MNDNEIIYDLVKEVREEQKEIRNDISDIKEVLTVNTTSLQEHMRRTDTLEKMYMQHANRLQSLEEPKKFREMLFKKYVKIAGAVAATMSVIGAWAKWQGLL